MEGNKRIDPRGSNFDRDLDLAVRKVYDSAFKRIEDMGFYEYFYNTPSSKSDKLEIVEKMIHWFEGQEEYERCAYLKKGLDWFMKQENLV